MGIYNASYQSLSRSIINQSKAKESHSLHLPVRESEVVFISTDRPKSTPPT